VPPSEIAGYTIAQLIGIHDAIRALPLIRDFAGAIAAGASDDAIERGIIATPHLLAALPQGLDSDDRANRLGLLFQAYAATATLIDNYLHGFSTPAVVLTRRWAACDVEICGVQLKQGDAVVVMLTASKLQFGFGRHRCPGQHIAEAIAKAVE
jgi:hypothetical protein